MTVIGVRSLTMLVAALCLAALSYGQSPLDADEGARVATGAPVRERLLLVPLAIGHDRVVQLHARLCLPALPEPAILVLINHGSPPVSSDRPKMKLGGCDQEAAQ